MLRETIRRVRERERERERERDVERDTHTHRDRKINKHCHTYRRTQKEREDNEFCVLSILLTVSCIWIPVPTLSIRLKLIESKHSHSVI